MNMSRNTLWHPSPQNHMSPYSMKSSSVCVCAWTCILVSTHSQITFWCVLITETFDRIIFFEFRHGSNRWLKTVLKTLANLCHVFLHAWRRYWLDMTLTPSMTLTLTPCVTLALNREMLAATVMLGCLIRECPQATMKRVLHTQWLMYHFRRKVGWCNVILLGFDLVLTLGFLKHHNL